MLSQALFNPGVNNLLAKLDDHKSMFSVAMRDGVDSTGRTVMEYKRDRHGGRERLVEDFLTTLVWGFGINFLKQKVYDPLARKLSPVKAPDLDMDLLMNGPQKLTGEVVNAFNRKFPGTYGHLADVMKNSALRQKYHLSNVLKFTLATGIPVLLIAFGIPTFNQWLTRRKTAAEKRNLPPQGVASPKLASIPSFRQPDAFRSIAKEATHPSMNTLPSGYFSAGQLSDRITNSTLPTSNQFRAGTTQVGSNGMGSSTSLSAEQVRFNGLGNSVAMAASGLLQNERYNTLLVDGVLSGGRIYKARNWSERAEIIFREGTIILFLYFAQGLIQKHIGRLIDRLTGANSRLGFRCVKFLHDRFGDNGAQFLSEHRQAMGALENAIPGLREILGNEKRYDELEKPLTDFIRRSALTGNNGNLILETAKTSQWIPVIREKGGRQLLDLGRKVETEPILQLMHALEGMSRQVGGQNPNFSRLLKKTMAGRFGAMLLANAVCAFFLSYLCPKIQHWITYKRTGQNKFPGISI